jgi:hypothetical protein
LTYRRHLDVFWDVKGNITNRFCNVTLNRGNMASQKIQLFPDD